MGKVPLVEPGALGRLLILLGLCLAVVGGLLLLGQAFPSLRLGRLPGDLRIERDGFSLYVPFTTMILLSLLLSGAWWLIRWIGK